MVTYHDSSATFNNSKATQNRSVRNIFSFENTSSTIFIIGHKLNENNYLQWSHSVKIFICGKGKLDYRNRVIKCPSKINITTYKQLEIENSTIMSWFINSITTK